MTDRNSKPGVDGIIQFHERIYNLLEQSLENLEDSEMNWRPSPNSNTIGNLLKHIVGSASFWILYVVGGLGLNRDRPSEFESKDFRIVDLQAELNMLKSLSDRVLTALTDETLAELKIFDLPWAPSEGENHATVHWCIMHAIEHTSGHIGQIFYIRKMYADSKMD